MSLPGIGRAQIRDNGPRGTGRAGLPENGLPGVSPVGLPGAAPQSAALPAAMLPTRIKLAALPTPLIPAPRLGAAMGIEYLQVKRDDLTGFAFGGNKARPLEFLVAAAREQGADTLVTGGAAGSNFCAATAAAARRAGLACHLLIAGQPSQNSPGLDLARSWGATVSWTHATERASVDTGLPRAAATLAAAGRQPYVIPRGGATALGAIGYALAVGELHDQLARRGLRADCVLVAVGSGGTLAGLLAGSALLGHPWRLVGASVSRPPAEAARRVLQLARDCLSLLAVPGRASGEVIGCQVTGQEAAWRNTTGHEAPGQHAAGQQPVGQESAWRNTTGHEAPGQHAAGPAITACDLEIVDARGPGHGMASADGDYAADMALRTEGLVVDPVYTAKALAVLRDTAPHDTAPHDTAPHDTAPYDTAPYDTALRDIADRHITVFWHTGGLLDVIAAAGAQR